MSKEKDPTEILKDEAQSIMPALLNIYNREFNIF